ncbi:COMM domain-containing protein 5-like [Symsagittifera roscoffensis]|uniref:COMM domain-containing protein 5-like n=1 Tax=Symsagittifera roscoffensis TaxID=84072 RepID=UPI00307B1AF2
MVSGEVESQFNLITSGNAHKFISKLGSNLADWEQSKWRKILKVVTTAIKSDDVTDEQLEVIENESEQAVFLGLLDICQQTIAFSVQLYRQEHLIKDLTSLNLPNALIEDLVQLLFVSKREELSSAVVANGPCVKRLADVKFRIDIILSNNRMKKVLQPRVTLSMELSDGSVRQVELDNDSLQLLRYKTAMCLKEIQLVKAQPIMANP